MGMSSINTNLSAMTALQSLQQTSKDLLTTQNRISTGLKVAFRFGQRRLLVDRDDDEVGQRRALDRSGRARPR